MCVSLCFFVDILDIPWVGIPNVVQNLPKYVLWNEESNIEQFYKPNLGMSVQLKLFITIVDYCLTVSYL